VERVLLKIEGEKEGRSYLRRVQSGSLKSRWEFDQVFNRGRKIVNTGFALRYLNVDRTGLRIGICVGKSLANAVKRNRLKRQIREIIRRVDFKQDSIDMVLVARRGILDKDFDYIRKRIFEALGRARLI